MIINEHAHETSLVLAIDGRLDNAASDHFRDLAVARISEGTRYLIVDFTQVSFVASMGIRALFIPAKELKAKGGRIALCGLNAEIRNLFLVAGVLDLFPVYETAAKALEKA